MMKAHLIRRVSSLSSAAKYDAIIIGGGHNGLVCSAYLARAGKRVCVLERRHVLGGAAVTEEIVPGFKFSRASYVLGLLRPQISKELELEKHGLKVYLRNPSSYTPLQQENWPKEGTKGRSLLLGMDETLNKQQIAQFSAADAENFPKYEAMLNRFADAIGPLLDSAAPDIRKISAGSLLDKLRALPSFKPLLQTGLSVGGELSQFLQLLTAPTTRILKHWFQSEPLMATLATDSVIGAMITPDTPGSGYVLLHHVMAQVGGVRGAWGYPEGGMGAVSEAIASSARASGAHIHTNQRVSSILLDSVGRVAGVETEDGSRVYSSTVLCNATPAQLLSLLPEDALPQDYRRDVAAVDYTSPVGKINVAISGLPNFLSDPSTSPSTVMPHHRCTVHLNCEHSSLINEAYEQAKQGIIPDKPLIEMTIPSSLDPTLAPKGCHVALFFVQYLPYTLKHGQWDDATKEQFAKQLFETVEQYAPGFSSSVLGYEVLPPPDLERIFGLTGGNIFHGAMSLDRLFWSRPSPAGPGPFTPIPGLMMCGAGAHPGGGVMGAPGMIAAAAVLRGRN